MALSKLPWHWYKAEKIYIRWKTTKIEIVPMQLTEIICYSWSTKNDTNKKLKYLNNNILKLKLLKMTKAQNKMTYLIIIKN